MFRTFFKKTKVRQGIIFLNGHSSAVNPILCPALPTDNQTLESPCARSVRSSPVAATGAARCVAVACWREH